MRFATGPISVLFSFIAAFLLCGGLLGMVDAAHAQQTFQVDNRGDTGDANPGDGTCDTGSGVCTLRAAIEESNADTDRDVIEFGNIPLNTNDFAPIPVGSELVITEEVFINGTTATNWSAPGPPIVILDGSAIPSSGNGSLDGLDIRGTSASKTRIDALAINGFPDDGIEVQSSANDVVIAYCYVGLGVDGTSDVGNRDQGIVVSTSGVLIGRDLFTGGRNYIAGNASDGIYLNSSSGNVRVGENYIGVTADGSATVGNDGDGIRVDGGTGHQLGYSRSTSFGTFYHGNLISGNAKNGILLAGGTATVLDNRVGTSADGMSALANETGIAIESGGHTIGPSSDSRTRNVISGNTFNGIRVGNGGTSTPGDNNTIQFNYVGVTSDASSTLGNGQSSTEAGVRIDLGADNVITGNVISGNTTGVFIRNNSSLRNVVRSNFIGTNRTFDDLGNNGIGVLIDVAPKNESDENEVGGANSGDGNVIGFNGTNGVEIRGRYNDVFRNFVGTNDNGADLGNGRYGVFVNGANNVNVGGSSSSVGNVVGFNQNGGIYVMNADAAFITANYVGTNPDGDNLGNGGAGITIFTSSSGSQANDNRIGYTFSSTVPDDPAPAGGGVGNVVAFNAGQGLVFWGKGTILNAVARGNLVYENGGVGIDLDNNGITSNDFGDGDSGINKLINWPEFEDSQTQYNESTGEVEVRYRVNCNTTNCNYGSNGLKVDFYLVDNASSGEGETYLYTDQYPSGAATNYRNISFAPPSGVSVSRSDVIVAITTDADGNTSEFTGMPSVLPVELAGFEVQQDGTRMRLGWRTVSETDNAGFHVERAVDGGAYTRLHYVAGAGTTTEAQSYRFADPDVPFEADEVSYRLRQVDLDGTATLSDPVVVALRTPDRVVLQAPFPNPVRTEATLRYALPEAGDVEIAIYNVLGQRVATFAQGQQAAGRVEQRVSTDGLANGVYFVRLRVEDQVQTQRLTVVR